MTTHYYVADLRVFQVHQFLLSGRGLPPLPIGTDKQKDCDMIYSRGIRVPMQNSSKLNSYTNVRVPMQTSSKLIASYTNARVTIKSSIAKFFKMCVPAVQCFPVFRCCLALHLDLSLPSDRQILGLQIFRGNPAAISIAVKRHLSTVLVTACGGDILNPPKLILNVAS